METKARYKQRQTQRQVFEQAEEKAAKQTQSLETVHFELGLQLRHGGIRWHQHSTDRVPPTRSQAPAAVDALAGTVERLRALTTAAAAANVLPPDTAPRPPAGLGQPGGPRPGGRWNGRAGLLGLERL